MRLLRWARWCGVGWVDTGPPSWPTLEWIFSADLGDRACVVRSGFADNADVRYTADARVWCSVALGLSDAADLYKRGLLTKEGSRVAMDDYFHQVARSEDSAATPKRSKP